MSTETEWKAPPRIDGLRLTGNAHEDAEYVTRLLARGHGELESICEGVREVCYAGGLGRECLRSEGIIDALYDTIQQEDAYGQWKHYALLAAGALCSNFTEHGPADKLYIDEASQVMAVSLLEKIGECLSSTKPEVAAAACDAIANIVYNNHENQIKAGSLKLMKPLTDLLSNFDTRLQASAATAIRCLCVNIHNAKVALGVGTIPALVQLLSSFDLDVQSRAAEALWSIGLADQHKIAVIEGGAVQPLVIMLSSRDYQCQFAALGALRILATFTVGKGALIRAGVLPAVAALLSANEVHLQVNAIAHGKQCILKDPKLNIVANIADMSNSIPGVSNPLVVKRSQKLRALLSN